MLKSGHYILRYFTSLVTALHPKYLKKEIPLKCLITYCVIMLFQESYITPALYQMYNASYSQILHIIKVKAPLN